MEGQGNFCRGCLIRYEESNELLQYTEKNRRQFFYVTGLQVKCNDAFTFQLCKECYINMKIACKFRKQCRSSDKKLKNYLSLKEAGDSMDFCTFLTNNDDTFRFPFMTGCSTPSHNKLKDDDNESTTTSIRNFMTDMMESEEIPDVEASLIREVIAEEADIMDDSLDSHWLRDDMSIDTDFQLDLSVSPFATPRSLHDDHCYSPLRELKPPVDNKSMPDLSSLLSAKKMIKEVVPDTIDRNLAKAIKNEKDVYPLEDLIVSPAPEYPQISTPTITDILFGKSVVTDNVNNEIDLKQKNNIQIYPEDKNIDNYLEDNSQSNLMPRVGQCIETFENVQGDPEVINDFFESVEPRQETLKLNFYVDPDEFMEADTKTKDPEKPAAEIYELSRGMKEILNIKRSQNKYKCHLCNFTCKSYRILENHTLQIHNVKFRKNKKQHLCTECGRNFTDISNFKRHLVRHEKEKLNPNGFYCDICKRQFTSKSKIEGHMTVHFNIRNKKNDQTTNTIKKKYVCHHCGIVQNSKSNHLVHLKRHQKDYTHKCIECGKGYCRKYDLEHHMRSHTNIKPYECSFCGKKHKSGFLLKRHIQCKHTDEKPYQCKFCFKRYVSKSYLLAHMEKTEKCQRLRRQMEKQYLEENNEAVKINVSHKNVANLDDISVDISKVPLIELNRNTN